MKSTDTNSALLADNVQYYCSKKRLPIQPVVPGLFQESAFRESVLSSVFWVPWVIIRIEIKKEKRCIIV